MAGQCSEGTVRIAHKYMLGPAALYSIAFTARPQSLQHLVAYTDRQGTPNGQRSEAIRRANTWYFASGHSLSICATAVQLVCMQLCIELCIEPLMHAAQPAGAHFAG